MRKHVYECDRCRQTVSVDANLPPERWTLFKLQVVPAPLDVSAALADALKQPRHLCPTCTDQLQEWLGSPELKLVQ